MSEIGDIIHPNIKIGDKTFNQVKVRNLTFRTFEIKEIEDPAEKVFSGQKLIKVATFLFTSDVPCDKGNYDWFVRCTFKDTLTLAELEGEFREVILLAKNLECEFKEVEK